MGNFQLGRKIFYPWIKVQIVSDVGLFKVINTPEDIRGLSKEFTEVEIK